uniref:Uncharacterized protein n=1 Tax=Lepeophtheirus salmonis TaxID=72036 RepID=A0A0K2TVW3_LEPSM
MPPTNKLNILYR